MPSLINRTVTLPKSLRKIVLPEAIRVVVIPAYDKDRSTNVIVKWPEPKDPNERIDFVVDWSKRMDKDDTIASTTFNVVEGQVTVDDSSYDGKTATVWLVGGQHGETCPILNRIVTTAGREMEYTIYVDVVTK